VIEFFPEPEDANAFIERVRADDADLAEELRVERVEFG
jgi:hypothetical protein